MSEINGPRGIALSVDVEPWWAGLILKRDYSDQPDITASAVRRLLQVLERKGARATFFILGRVAESDPALVEEIASQGHEIGSHGYDHTSIWDTEPPDFVESERMVIETLRSLTGERPIGFRAPNFSVRKDTVWVYEALEKDLGYRYSSSVFPMWTPLYGYPGMPLHPFIPNGGPRSEGEGILEFPLTIYRRSVFKMPLCGGAYLRFQPAGMVRNLLARVLEERPAVVNIHPRDFFPLERIPDDIGRVKRVALFHGAGGTLAKLERLMDAFDFRPIREVLSL